MSGLERKQKTVVESADIDKMLNTHRTKKEKQSAEKEEHYSFHKAEHYSSEKEDHYSSYTKQSTTPQKKKSTTPRKKKEHQFSKEPSFVIFTPRNTFH